MSDLPPVVFRRDNENDLIDVLQARADILWAAQLVAEAEKQMEVAQARLVEMAQVYVTACANRADGHQT